MTYNVECLFMCLFIISLSPLERYYSIFHLRKINTCQFFKQYTGLQSKKLKFSLSQSHYPKVITVNIVFIQDMFLCIYIPTNVILFTHMIFILIVFYELLFIYMLKVYYFNITWRPFNVSNGCRICQRTNVL